VKVLFASAVTAILLYFGYSQIPQEIENNVFETQTTSTYNYYEILPTIKENYKNLQKEQKIRDIENTWTEIFDEAGASPDDNRRMYFRTYAESIVEILEAFQDKDSRVVKETGVSLPKNKLLHILIAYIVYRGIFCKPNSCWQKA
jgi:hypothetical protein